MCGRFCSLFCICLLVCTTRIQNSHCRSENHSQDYSQNEQKEKDEDGHESLDHRYFLKEIFKKYGQGDAMTFKQFENLLFSLGLNQLMKNYVSHYEFENRRNLGPLLDTDAGSQGSNTKNISSNHMHDHENIQCMTATEIIHSYNISPDTSIISPLEFLHICPAIIHQLDHRCADAAGLSLHLSHKSEGKSMNKHVWIYASVAVLAISLCGLLCVAIIPIMQRVCYHTLLQFLVGMAIGSLSGDALLHLLPHAMVANENHHDKDTISSHGEVAHVWRGLTALAGVYIFFIAERLLNLLTNYRRRRKSAMLQLQTAKMPKLVHALQAVDNEQSRVVGEKLSHHKHGSYGYSVDPSAMEALQRLNDVTVEEKDSPSYCDKAKDDHVSNHAAKGDAQPDGDWDNVESRRMPPKKSPSPVKSLQVEVGYVATEKPTELDIPIDECHRETVVYDHTDNSYVVTVTEHHMHHHGHGHSHEVPNSISAVAWMVVMGDGLHNFCDGLAIGAAFAAEASGGLSTTIAVFCHELPHELGDFAMLLKAGMTVKQALLYNGLSSVLCFVGMLIGVALGNVQSATLWVFAGAAGMFLYIALVDMLPELGSSPTHPGSNSTYLLAVQLTGISLGIVVMLIIAIYEHDLQHIVN